MHGLTSSRGGIVYVFWDYSPTRIQNQIQLTFFLCCRHVLTTFTAHSYTGDTNGIDSFAFHEADLLFDLSVYRIYNDRFT